MHQLFTLRSASSHREEIRKSRFLVHAVPIACPEDAMAFFASTSDAGASHNCWAYRIGVAYRFNDDGEPGGTAGRPILQAIDGQSCDKVAVLVVRWFGGILLGAGGLMRAYGGSAANCLRQADRIPLVDTVGAEFRCAFSELPLIRSRLREYDAQIGEISFLAEGVQVALILPRHVAAPLAMMLLELSRGRAVLRVNGS